MSLRRRLGVFGLAALCASTMFFAGCDSGGDSGDGSAASALAFRNAALNGSGDGVNGGELDPNGGGPRNPGPGTGQPVPFPGGGNTPPPGSGGRLFITHFGDDTVGVYDATNYSLLDEVVVGNSPRGLAFDTTRNRVIVTLEDGTVVTFAADDFNDVDSTTTPGTFPADVAFSNDAIFVPHRLGGELTVLNANDLSPLDSFALSELVEVRIDDAGDRAFTIQNNAGPVLFVVDLVNGTTTNVDPQTGPILDGLAYDNSTNERLFVGGFGGSNVAVLDASSAVPTHVQTIATSGSSPTGIAVDPEHGHVFTANFATGDMTVFDDNGGVTNPVLSNATTLPTAGGAITVVYDDQRDRVICVNQFSDTISVYQVSDTSITPVAGRDFTTGSQPYSLLVEPALGP